MLKFFIIGITIIVVAIPEGLPLAVTLSLAFSMKKMLKENNLVRHLDACETMGSATAICSDKTGTLTTNRMTVVRALFGDCNMDASGSMSSTPFTPAVLACFTEGVSVNSTAEVVRPASGVGLYEHVGSKTECALLQYIMENKADYTAIRSDKKHLLMFPFNSASKASGAMVATVLLGRSPCSIVPCSLHILY